MPSRTVVLPLSVYLPQLILLLVPALAAQHGAVGGQGANWFCLQIHDLVAIFRLAKLGNQLKTAGPPPPPAVVVGLNMCLFSDADAHHADVLQHRPRALDKLVIHKDVGENLQKLVRWS